jgi:hypothetical protein
MCGGLCIGGEGNCHSKQRDFHFHWKTMHPAILALSTTPRKSGQPSHRYTNSRSGPIIPEWLEGVETAIQRDSLGGMAQGNLAVPKCIAEALRHDMDYVRNGRKHSTMQN